MHAVLKPSSTNEEMRPRTTITMDTMYLLGLLSKMIDASPPKLKPTSSKMGAAAAAAEHYGWRVNEKRCGGEQCSGPLVRWLTAQRGADPGKTAMLPRDIKRSFWWPFVTFDSWIISCLILPLCYIGTTVNCVVAFHCTILLSWVLSVFFPLVPEILFSPFGPAAGTSSLQQPTCLLFQMMLLSLCFQAGKDTSKPIKKKTTTKKKQRQTFAQRLWDSTGWIKTMIYDLMGTGWHRSDVL